MPETRSKSSTRSRKASSALKDAGSTRPTVTDARNLISKMLEFEAAAMRGGVDFSASRFQKLTASERDFVRAELVADYIRLSAGNTGRTPGYYDAALASFSAKICDLQVPSHELMGTYLAALDVAATEPYMKENQWLADTIRRTMPAVLEACVEVLHKKSESLQISR